MPLLIRKAPVTTDFLKEPQVSILLGEFGGSYKKNCKTEPRTQHPVYPDKGRQEVAKHFQPFVDSLPPAIRVSDEGLQAGPLPNVLETLWIYGYTVDLKDVGSTPNGLPMWKLMCSGEVRYILLNITKLVAALAALGEDGHDELTIEDLFDG